MTDFSTESATENPAKRLQSSEARARRVIDHLEGNKLSSGPSPEPTIIRRNQRDNLIISCVKFGLSQTQIRDFSLSWPQPITTVSQVSDKVRSLNLSRTFKQREKKRIGPHNGYINRLFIRIAGQMMEHGWTLERFERERKVFDFASVQPDFYVEAVRGKRRERFCFEIQASPTNFTLWGKKLRGYVKAYEKAGFPFRVPLMLHSDHEITESRRGAREALGRSSERINLFLFALIDEIERKHNDVVTTLIWQSTWKDMRNWSLLPC